MSKKIVVKLKNINEITEENKHGKSISFSEIDKGGAKEKTWIGYIGFITKFYDHFNLPDKKIFYWEYLSKKDNIDKIILQILNTYTVKDGNSLAAKISPFRSIVIRLPGSESLDALHNWGEMVIYARNNFNEIISELGDQIKKKDIQSDPRLLVSWDNARENLHKVSNMKNIDSRVRVLATIYKYGYILRMSTIFKTYIHLGGSSLTREHYNYLDLTRRIWHINENGMDKISFKIPDNMAKELQVLTHRGPFSKGWLLPQRRGTPYAPEASLSSFTSWTKSGLLNYRTYRKVFSSWLKSTVPIDDYEVFENVLDERLLFETVIYIPPNPDYDISDIESQLSDISKEILPEQGRDLSK